MALAQETIEQVKGYDDIVRIISEYVVLKKRGRNYIGNCPFHSEKTPSFTVSPEKQIWHCFGCHESGDHISFVMKIDSLSFPDAVKHIAERVGIAIVEDERVVHSAHHSNDQVQEILFHAREIFKSALSESPATQQYLSSRKITMQTSQQFHLGFCPQDLNLEALLLKRKCDQTAIRQSGLFSYDDHGQSYLRFRGRLMFPIIDYRGRTLGFGGRILDHNKQAAKYINSEESVLFNKRKLLYGLHLAKEAVKAKQAIIVMEGYMDVIAAHQFGFANAVGTMGTALTAEQVQKLKRFTSTVYLALDSDDAGQAAAEKNYAILRQHDCNVRIVKLHTHKDPADFITVLGGASFQDALENGQAIIDFQFNRVLARYQKINIDTIPDIINAMAPLLRLETDPIVQRHYIRKMAERLGIQEELIMAKLKKSRYNVKTWLSDKAKPSKNKFQKAESLIIYLMATNNTSREELNQRLSVQDFITAEHRALFEKISQTKLENRDLLTVITEPNLQMILSQLFIEWTKQDIVDNIVVEDCIQTLKGHKTGQRISEIKLQIKALENNGDDSQVDQLLQELQNLMRL